MYQLYSPPAHLQKIVRHYWLLDLRTSNKNLTEYIFAYPYLNWVFTIGVPYTVKDEQCGCITIKDTRILGPRTNFAEYFHPEGNLAFGVTFQPGATLSVFKEEAKSLTNKIILQDDILPDMKWLTSFFKETQIDNFIPSLSEQINRIVQDNAGGRCTLWCQFIELITTKNHYLTPVYLLAKDLKVSQRHLQRITMLYIGLSPKHVQSMLRCRQAIRHIQRTGQMSDFFHCDYFDQNHFIREIKKWTGHTPKKLLSLLKR